VARLADAGAFAGTVLDAGCGTGDNALYLAARGVTVLGFDVAPTAVATAQRRAAAADAPAEFVLADALNLSRLGRAFDSVLDSALFHTFDDTEQRAYAASLASVTNPGGRLHLLCFSDADPQTAGPHPVSREELHAAFNPASGWIITSIDSDWVLTRFVRDGVPAWLATITRTGP
jgi:cyclopropane fatty-acyl-phospholipid synthase-like methyltransferase